jgi:LysM repeat protein
MAKKTPKKFRQARAAAKADAKKAFSGKKQAVRRDPSLKYSADDIKALKEVSKEARAGIITDDRGNRINVKPTETARERIARENAEAMRKFREQAEMEDGPKKKVEASKKFGRTDKRTPAEKEASKKAASKEVAKNTKKFVAKGSNAVVDTPVSKGGPLEKKLTAEKKMTRAEKSAANKARWAKMTPAERKNWSATKGTEAKPAVKKAAAAPKAAPAVKEPVTKRPTLASLKKNEAKALEEAKARVAAKNKALADSAKGKTQTPQAVEAKKKAAAKPEGKAAVKKPAVKTPKKFGKTRAAAKGGAYLALGGELVSLAKGSTKKDFDEINRLERKLANVTGKGKSTATAARQAAGMQLSNLASLATMGVVGKTRRQRMDELNRLITKAEKKNAPKQLRYGKDGSSLVPGTAAYKAGSTTRPTKPVANKPVTGGGGTTTNVYTVKKGDTLSGIAKANETTLAALREANPKFMKNKKYKQGSMIWSGTKVRIPKK